MKLLKTKTISKSVLTYGLHPSCPQVTLEAVYEGKKLISVMLKGKAPRKDFYPGVVKPEFWETIKTYNPWWQVKGKYVLENMIYEPKELLEMDEIDPANIIWWYHSGHMIFALNGDPIPIPHGYDYIGAPFSNEVLDLKPALEHLKKHPWVINADELKIVDVPYYNNDGGWRKYIVGEELPFIAVLPDAAAYKEIYESVKDDKYFSVRVKEAIHSGPHYTWDAPIAKDWMEIRQFYKPRENRYDD